MNFQDAVKSQVQNQAIEEIAAQAESIDSVTSNWERPEFDTVTLLPARKRIKLSRGEHKLNERGRLEIKLRSSDERKPACERKLLRGARQSYKAMWEASISR